MKFADNTRLSNNEMEVHIASYVPNGSLYWSVTLRDDKIEVGTMEWYNWLRKAVPNLGRGATHIVEYTTTNIRDFRVIEHSNESIFHTAQPSRIQKKADGSTEGPETYYILFI